MSDNSIMRAVQVVARGKAEFVQTEKPQLRPGHALVRTQQVSLCGSDIRYLKYAAPEKYPFPPGTTGHEMVGVVEAVDAPESGIKVGDVALTLVTDHRAMAEYYVAPTNHVLVLPPGKPVDALLQAQQLGTVIYACKFLPNVVGKDVAVIGQGSVGLFFNFMLRRMGARRVIALDLQDFRLKAGRLYGATDTIHNVDVDPAAAIAAITGGEMADIVIEAAGEIETINMAVDLVKKYGFILYFGVPRGQVFEFNFELFFDKCLQSQTIVGSLSDPGLVSTYMALDMIASGEIDVSPMLTHHFPFEQTLEAYELHQTRDEGAIKIVIDMPQP